MSKNLILISGLFSLFIIIMILFFIRKNKINIKYSLIWLLLFIIFLIFLIIPGFLDFITHVLGFQTSSNMIFAVMIGVLVIITISLTGIVSSQDKKIRLLIQEVSFLKSSDGRK